MPKGVELSGHSKSWLGGGVVVTEGNVKQMRALLVAVASAKVPAPTKEAETLKKQETPTTAEEAVTPTT